MTALGQEAFLKTQVGTPGMFKFCKSMFPCGTPFASDNTGAYTGTADREEGGADAEGSRLQRPARSLLMRPTDLAGIAKLPLVAKQQLEAAGFKVDMQQMDWSTLLARRAKKDAPDKGGWNAFMTSWTAGDILNPLTMAMLNATGDKGWFGWQDDKTIEELKAKFAQAGHRHREEEARRAAAAARGRDRDPRLARPVQQPGGAARSNISGLVPAGAQVYWNIKKN